MHVHDLVDYVSNEAKAGGNKCAKYLRDHLVLCQPLRFHMNVVSAM